MNSKTRLLTGFIITLSIFAACDDSVAPGPGNYVPNDDPVIEYFTETVADALEDNKNDHEDAADYVWNEFDVVEITLNGNSISVDGIGAVADGNIVTIMSAGTYRISGTLIDGRVIVDTDDEETIRLILNGVDIACLTNSPISIAGAEKTIIILQDYSENHVSDGHSYIFDDPEDDEPNAAIFSKDNLTIYGGGSLTVDGNYNDGISSKDGLIIVSGRITINSVDDGIRGKDYLVVKGGDITVNAQGDGLKSDDSDDNKGYIHIESGTLDIICADDGIQAETDALVSGGVISISTGKISDYLINESSSFKGIKTDVSMIIDGGTITIDSADDGLHSNGDLVINGGTFLIACADDGVHADSTLGINGGDIRISKCYEGVESAVLSITDGDIRVVSSDDGLNASKGEANYLFITGGYIAIDSSGDGIDVNGSMVMTGGLVIVHGSESSLEGALDFDDSFKMTGGFLLATGNPLRVQAPGEASTQISITFKLGDLQAAGDLVNIRNSEGEALFTFAPWKPYTSIVFSSPQLQIGSTYTFNENGSSTGLEIDGLFSGGTYTPGEISSSFTVSDTVSTIHLR